MRELTITRQRIKSNTRFGLHVSAEERIRRLEWGAAEDTERDYGGAWTVDSVQILSSFTDDHMDRVIALVTEHKRIRVPQTPAELEGWSNPS